MPTQPTSVHLNTDCIQSTLLLPSHRFVSTPCSRHTLTTKHATPASRFCRTWPCCVHVNIVLKCQSAVAPGQAAAKSLPPNQSYAGIAIFVSQTLEEEVSFHGHTSYETVPSTVGKTLAEPLDSWMHGIICLAVIDLSTPKTLKACDFDQTGQVMAVVVAVLSTRRGC
ncbi:hypothetical protein EDC01DRAFT_105563 [Geopyxis carbonaria]|nr:hypothetical protein EDC01DRAFT_105563 [Geopyxis carbonaria]